MIYENQIIFKELVKCDIKEKFYYKNIINITKSSCGVI